MFRPLDSLDLSRQPLVAPSALVTYPLTLNVLYIYSIVSYVLTSKAYSTVYVLLTEVSLDISNS